MTILQSRKAFWKKLSPGQLNVTIQAFSLVAIFFEGYDQGVMGGNTMRLIQLQESNGLLVRQE